jgi:hypothetical protein
MRCLAKGVADADVSCVLAVRRLLLLAGRWSLALRPHPAHMSKTKTHTATRHERVIGDNVRLCRALRAHCRVPHIILLRLGLELMSTKPSEHVTSCRGQHLTLHAIAVIPPRSPSIAGWGSTTPGVGISPRSCATSCSEPMARRRRHGESLTYHAAISAG